MPDKDPPKRHRVAYKRVTLSRSNLTPEGQWRVTAAIRMHRSSPFAKRMDGVTGQSQGNALQIANKFFEAVIAEQIARRPARSYE